MNEEELWILEDLNLDNILNLNINSKKVMSKNSNLLGAGYYEHSGGHSAYVNWYSRMYTAYAYTNNYGNYSNYSNYSNACVIACQICNTGQHKCDINQYISYWIGPFDYDLENNFIFAQNYNNLIDYINEAASWLNNLINKYQLDDNLKIDLINNNKRVSITDIYETEQFNLINDKINSFINGITAILTKIKDEDFILLEDMEKIKNILNQIQLPMEIPCCQIANYENCASRQK